MLATGPMLKYNLNGIKNNFSLRQRQRVGVKVDTYDVVWRII